MGKEYKDHEKTYKLLNEIIPCHDVSYSTDAYFQSQLLEQKIKQFMPFPNASGFKVRGIKGSTYFKIDFTEPVIQFVPNEMKHLRTLIHSTVIANQLEMQNQYTYAFVPSYIPNVNHITLRVTENEHEVNAEISSRKEDDVYNLLTWENKYTPMSFDTLNRFLKEYSSIKEGLADENLKKKIRMCFELCYWRPPDFVNLGRISFFDKPGGFGFISTGEKRSDSIHFRESAVYEEVKKGDMVEYELGTSKKGPTAINVKKIRGLLDNSVIHNFVYDRPSSIADLVQVRKTIARIDKIDEREKKITLVDRNQASVRQAKVTFLTYDGKNFSAVSQSAYITKNAAQQLDDGDIISCIAAKSVSRKKSGFEFSRITIIGCVGKKIKNDLGPYIGLAAWKKMQVMDNANLCKMGSTSDFKRDLLEILNLIGDSGIDSDMLDKIFGQSVESLFPLFVINDGMLYHNPPALVSHVAVEYPQALDSREQWTQITRMMELFLSHYEEWGPKAQMRLRRSETYHEMQKDPDKIIDANHLFNSLPTIVKNIVYSRIFSQHWE